MNKILRRVKLDLIKKYEKSLLKCVVFIILFSMLFTSLYIQNISKQLEDSIIKEFDIMLEINPNISTYDDKTTTFYERTIQYEEMIGDLQNNTKYSYSDFNLSNKGYRSPIYTMGINDSLITLYAGGGYEYTNGLIWNEFTNNQWPLGEDLKSTRNPTPKDFELGLASIIDGRTFTDEEIQNGENVCIIPVGLKKYENGLSKSVWIGDEITISEILKDDQGNIIYYNEHTYTVIGNYSTSDGSGMKTMMGLKELPIYIPESNYQEMLENSIMHASEYYDDYLDERYLFNVHPTIFKFSNVDDFNSFLDYLEKYSDRFNNGYTYSTTMETQFPTIANILSVSKSISYISILCMVACICITFILILFDIETSKKEIGILLSLGESIKGVVVQYILEILIISALAVTVSYGVTQTAGVEIAQNLIQNQISDDETIKFNDSDYEFEIEKYEEILKPLSIAENVSITFAYMLGICIFEGAVLYILIKRIDPKDLLKDS